MKEENPRNFVGAVQFRPISVKYMLIKNQAKRTTISSCIGEVEFYGKIFVVFFQGFYLWNCWWKGTHRVSKKQVTSLKQFKMTFNNLRSNVFDLMSVCVCVCWFSWCVFDFMEEYIKQVKKCWTWPSRLSPE